MTNQELNLLFNGKHYIIPKGTPVNHKGIITDVSFLKGYHEAEYYNIKINQHFLHK